MPCLEYKLKVSHLKPSLVWGGIHLWRSHVSFVYLGLLRLCERVLGSVAVSSDLSVVKHIFSCFSPRSRKDFVSDPGDCVSTTRPQPVFMNSNNFSVDIRMPGVVPTEVSCFFYSTWVFNISWTFHFVLFDQPFLKPPGGDRKTDAPIARMALKGVTANQWLTNCAHTTF